jgi:hypothetical protein
MEGRRPDVRPRNGAALLLRLQLLTPANSTFQAPAATGRGLCICQELPGHSHKLNIHKFLVFDLTSWEVCGRIEECHHHQGAGTQVDRARSLW